jgi:hypothetical protein
MALRRYSRAADPKSAQGSPVAGLEAVVELAPGEAEPVVALRLESPVALMAQRAEWPVVLLARQMAQQVRGPASVLASVARAGAPVV